MKNQIDRLKKALAFYAKKENYITKSVGFVSQYDPEPTAIELDLGARARIELGINDDK